MQLAGSVKLSLTFNCTVLGQGKNFKFYWIKNWIEWLKDLNWTHAMVLLDKFWFAIQFNSCFVCGFKCSVWVKCSVRVRFEDSWKTNIKDHEASSSSDHNLCSTQVLVNFVEGHRQIMWTNASHVHWNKAWINLSTHKRKFQNQEFEFI